MTATKPDLKETIEEIEKKTGVAYDLESDTVSFTGEKNDTESFIGLMEYLLREGCITRSDLPYTPGYGKIRYLLHTRPSHSDGRDMTRPVEVAEGVYLETNHDSESKKRYASQTIRNFVFN